MAPLVYVSDAPANVLPGEEFEISLNCAVKDLNNATLWLEVTPGSHRNANAGPAQEQYPPENAINDCTERNVLHGPKVATGVDSDGRPYTMTFKFRNLHFKEAAKGYLWTLFFTLMNDGVATGHSSTD
ncbi:hypothetical protein LIA77_01264 [Sarocladium implicatum]|nr:hypothetical protein LIA77_01264 [Sarocladium implicatum]